MAAGHGHGHGHRGDAEEFDAGNDVDDDDDDDDDDEFDGLSRPFGGADADDRDHGGRESGSDSDGGRGPRPTAAASGPSLSRVPTGAALAVARRCLDEMQLQPVLADHFQKCSRKDGARFKIKTMWRRRYVVLSTGMFAWFKKSTVSCFALLWLWLWLWLWLYV